MKNIPEYQLNFYKMIAEKMQDKKITVVYTRKNGLTSINNFLNKSKAL